MVDRSILLEAALLFFGLSFLCIGGTYPLLPDLHRYLVDQRALMTSREFATYVSLAQAAPGPNILYIALLGFHIAGVVGALTLLGAMSIAPFTMILLVSRVEARFRESTWRTIILNGLAPVTLGLLTAGTWTLTKSFGEWRPYALGVIAFIVFTRSKLHPLIMIAGGALAGVVLSL